MKLSFIVTGGGYRVVIESDDKICEISQYEFAIDDFVPPDPEDPDFDAICLGYLKWLAEYNSFEELYANCTAGEPDGFPHFSSAEYDADPDCHIAAQYIA